jgi:hypothetical protein
MAFNEKVVKDIGVLVLSLVIIAAMGFIVAPLFLGIGTQAATALSSNATITTSVNSGLSGTASTMDSVFSFLPWLGVGLLLMGALKLGKVF